MSKKLVIDVDTGTDDAQSIMMALSHSGSDVVGITCVHGNTTVNQVCLNTLRVLQVCDRLDIPVYRGAEVSLMGQSTGTSSMYHGKDGLGDCPDPGAPSGDLVKQEHAVQALLRLSREYQGELTVVALAPLTNIAMALRLDPDFSKRLKEIVIMGGNMHAVGNIMPCQEYNFHCDPEAAHITISEMECPIKLIPLEPTVTFGAPSYEFYEKEILPLRTPKAEFHHKIITVADAKRRASIGRCALCDVNATAIALEPSLVTESERVYCTVELKGSNTRSQVVIDWKGHLGKQPNVELIQNYDLDRFQCMYKDMFM